MLVEEPPRLSKSTSNGPGMFVLASKLGSTIQVYTRRVNATRNPHMGLIFDGVRNPASVGKKSAGKSVGRYRISATHHFIEPFLLAEGIQWRWWHPFRRGPATNLHRLGVADKVIQAVLRHSSSAVTMSAYVKDVSGQYAP